MLEPKKGEKLENFLNNQGLTYLDVTNEPIDYFNLHSEYQHSEWFFLQNKDLQVFFFEDPQTGVFSAFDGKRLRNEDWITACRREHDNELAKIRTTCLC